MAFRESTLTMRALRDENILAIIMENIDDPQTLFNLVVVLPIAQATFKRCPRQLLIAALTSLASELKLLAILYITLKQDHVTRASMIPIVWGYLRLDDTPGVVETSHAAVELTIPRNLCNPFETLKKLAIVWSAVEDLACGFVDCSIKLLQNCKAADAAGLTIGRYERGHKLRPLSHLWDLDIPLAGFPGHATTEKPQPWSLPLRASEILRVKRALWRLEIFAVISHKPQTFPNQGAIASGAVEIYHADPMGTLSTYHEYDVGTRMLLASLEACELGQLESVYDYLWCETIGKVYQHKIDPYMPHDEGSRNAQAEREVGTTSRLLEQYESNHAEFEAQLKINSESQKARKDYDRYLTYLMSLGLPFLHRVHQQITRDGGKIIPENYPPLRYRSVTGLRDTWDSMDMTRSDDRLRTYDFHLLHSKDGNWVTRKADAWPDGKSGSCTYCYKYLHTNRIVRNFCRKEVWQAGCYMWDDRR